MTMTMAVMMLVLAMVNVVVVVVMMMMMMVVIMMMRVLQSMITMAIRTPILDNDAAGGAEDAGAHDVGDENGDEHRAADDE